MRAFYSTPDNIGNFHWPSEWLCIAQCNMTEYKSVTLVNLHQTKIYFANKVKAYLFFLA